MWECSVVEQVTELSEVTCEMLKRTSQQVDELSSGPSR